MPYTNGAGYKNQFTLCPALQVQTSYFNIRNLSITDLNAIYIHSKVTSIRYEISGEPIGFVIVLADTKTNRKEVPFNFEKKLLFLRRP